MNSRARLLLVLALTPACDSKKEGAPASNDKVVVDDHDHARDRAHDRDREPTAKKPLAAEYFGKTVAPVGLLAQLAWGMPEADARKAAPVMFGNQGGKDYFSADDPAIASVRYGVGIAKDKRVVDRMSVKLPASVKAIVAAAWGPGKEGKDTIGRPRTFWFDPAAGWRAYIEPGFSDDIGLELHPYIPAEKLLGEGPDTIGFAPKGLVGATVADLRAQFPDAIVERSQAQAQADQKAVSKFAGKNLDKAIGPAHADVSLELPPTEWGEYWTNVNFMWTADGKVRDAWLALPFEAYGPARDELHALFEKKWGKGKPTRFLVQDATLYRSKAPFVVVTEDTITHAWEVRYLDKQPTM